MPVAASVPTEHAGLTVAPTPESDAHLLILLPGEPPDDELVAWFAETVGVSRYDARLSLASVRPRVFRRLASETLARELSEGLQAARIPHYVVSEQSVRQVAISRAQALKLDPQHLEVSLEGRNLSIPYESLLLLVRGEIVRERHNEKNLATPRGASRALSPGLLVHLYSNEAAVGVEIDPESIGWPELDGGPSSSTLVNLERFLDALDERTPGGVPVDRGFDFEPPVLSRAGASASGQDLAQVLSGGARGGILYDNQEQFRFYARWRYRLERHMHNADARRLGTGPSSA